MTSIPAVNKEQIAAQIKTWATDLGFQDARFVAPDVSEYIENHKRWVNDGMHGTMSWFEQNQDLRYDPKALVPGTKTILMVRLDYRPDEEGLDQLLDHPTKAYISRYALGRDYHKLMRKRLTQLGKKISAVIEPLGYRAFVDSAPVLERQLAEKSGMGWLGKNTLLLNNKAGSWFFLGALFLTLELDSDAPNEQVHCGSCTSCMDVCPTQAFTKAGVLDARLCISYLTIEHEGAIPEHLRSSFGNRIYGCDDCQIFCPFNKFSTPTDEKDFEPRNNLDRAELIDLFQWTEQEFLSKTEGSAIRRIGFERWQRNIAVALGNSKDERALQVLKHGLDGANDLLREHIEWAISKLET